MTAPGLTAPAPVTLVVGDEEVLADRAVRAVVRAARAADPNVVVTDRPGGKLEPGQLDELLAPSLFSEAKVVVVSGAQDCSKDVMAELVAYAGRPVPEAALVVVHAGGAKGKALVEGLMKTRPVRVDAAKVTKPGDRKDLVRREFQAAGRRIEPGALDRFMESVGSDLRELLGAAAQLCEDVPGTVTEAHVKAYYQGKAETSGFAVADRALVGDVAGALELAPVGGSTGVADVLLSSALASGLRLVGQVAGMSVNQAATATGMPGWKVEKAVRQAQGWTRTGLSAAVRAVARLDADVKGGSAAPGFAVDRAVLAVALARRVKDPDGQQTAEFGVRSA